MTTQIAVKKPIDLMLEKFPLAKGPNNRGWYNHPDNPKFDFRENEDGSVFIHPWSHHSIEDILAGKRLNKSDLFRNKRPSSFTHSKIDVYTLSHARRIPWQFLYNLGLSDGYSYHGRGVVKIPYHLPDGSEHTKIKVRKAINGNNKHCWDEGTPGEITPYGLDHLQIATEQGYLLIGEGESDGWACWYHGIPYLGLPGASQAKKLATYDIDLSPIPRIYVLHEPDQAKKLQNTGQGFYKDVHNILRGLGYTGEIFCVHFKQLTGCKDPGDLHIKAWDEDKSGHSFKTTILDALKHATPSGDDPAGKIENEEALLVKLQARVNTAIEQEAIGDLYDLAGDIAFLPTKQQALLSVTIQNKMTKCKDFKWIFFKRLMDEAVKARVAAEQSEKSEYGTEYEKTDTGMIYYTEKGNPVWISNFTTEIKADVITDDGAERTRSYELQAEIFGRHTHFEIPAKEFAKCEWVDEHLGAKARITTGQSMRSHLVNAIKFCSASVEHFHYAHTGWRKIDGHFMYLHASGALSQVSQVALELKEDLTSTSFFSETALQADLHSKRERESQVSQVSQENSQPCVRLTGTLMNYTFPLERNNLGIAIKASLEVLNLADDTITFPLYCAIWRALLGDVDFGIHLAGQTGWGKTELVALIQQHFGALMNAHKLPGSWESTENSLEMLLFQAKDTIVVVDDFKPKGGKVDQDRLHAKADRIFRQLGNGSARGRLTSNLEQRVERRPRCLMISTGEDVPRGQSLKARGVVLTMNERITSGDAARKLSEAQRDARSGLYAQAMAGYIEWLAPRIEAIQAQLPELIVTERERLSNDGHARSSTNMAHMLLGMKCFLQFAYESGAITHQEASAYLARCKAALTQIASEAGRENIQDRPTEQWRRLIVAALTNKSAYLATPSGENPGLEYGWKKDVREVWHDGTQDEEETFRGGGSQIGWIDGDDIYLLPAAAYKAAKAIGSATGDDITTLEPTLRKFLLQDGAIASTDIEKARKTITTRRSLEKLQRDVLHVKKKYFYPEAPLINSSDLDDLPDYQTSESASHASSEPSHVSDLNGSKSSHTPDYEPVEHEAKETMHTSETEAQAFYASFCSQPGHHLRLTEDGSIGIGVPGTVNDEEFEWIKQTVNLYNSELCIILAPMKG